MTGPHPGQSSPWAAGDRSDGAYDKRSGRPPPARPRDGGPPSPTATRDPAVPRGGVALFPDPVRN
jgi:hypothetical protein